MVARIAGFLVLRVVCHPCRFWRGRAGRGCAASHAANALHHGGSERSGGFGGRAPAVGGSAVGSGRPDKRVRGHSLRGEQLDRRAKQELAELTRQIAELQKKSERLQQLLGRPNQIAYKCRFLELSAKSAAEFYAAAGGEVKESATYGRLHGLPEGGGGVSHAPRSGKVGNACRAHRIVALPDQPATATTGGEFPVPTAGTGSRLSFVYRRFGYRCEIEPTLLELRKDPARCRARRLPSGTPRRPSSSTGSRFPR